MTSHTFIRLSVMAALLAAGPGWADVAVPASATVTSAAASSAAAPASASMSAPAAATVASAAPAASTAAPTASAAPAAATVAPATDAAAEPAAAPAPAPAAPVYVPAPSAGMSMPVRGMNMQNVEHIFGTPLEKEEAVGKPPITRWVYADYVVYFEYNMVLHSVLKSVPFSDSKADGNG